MLDAAKESTVNSMAGKFEVESFCSKGAMLYGD
jgi:hypothetical protein